MAFAQQYVNMLFVLGIVKISTGPRTLHIIFNIQDRAANSVLGCFPVLSLRWAFFPGPELANFLASHKHPAYLNTGVCQDIKDKPHLTGVSHLDSWSSWSANICLKSDICIFVIESPRLIKYPLGLSTCNHDS